MKTHLKSSFEQLLLVYSILILIISLGFLSKYTLQFQIFAFILAILSLFALNNNKQFNINKKLFYSLFILSLLLIGTLRLIPYSNNQIPLGYDTGIYKYGLEHALKNLDNWILQGGLEPGFLYFMQIPKLFFSSQFILTYLLIFFTVILGVAIYLTTKIYFNKETALLSILIYSISLIQFKTFWYMYYKNILGLILLLFSLYFLKKSQTNKKLAYLFILLAGILASFHRPTFYIFGLTYFIYTFTSPINKKYDFKLLKQNIFYGVLILIIALSFYTGKFFQAIQVMFAPVLQGFVHPGESPGTFIDFTTYQFSILPYLPLALISLFHLIKNKNYNFFVIWALINLAIVYFQFFFFNRFIIMLDIVLIILAAYGFNLIIENYKKLGTIITIILLFSASVLAIQDSINSKPLITENELTTIEYLQNTPQDAYVMSTSSIYSTWILGYSNRTTIAPGLFDYSLHNQEEWNNFWSTKDIQEVKDFLNVYKKPLYIFIGQKQPNNLEQFEECFNLYYENEKNKIYEYIC